MREPVARRPQLPDHRPDLDPEQRRQRLVDLIELHEHLIGMNAGRQHRAQHLAFGTFDVEFE